MNRQIQEMGWSREECCRYNAFVSGCATSIASLALMHPQAAERICKSALYRALATYDAVYCESAPLIVAAAPGIAFVALIHNIYHILFNILFFLLFYDIQVV